MLGCFPSDLELLILFCLFSQLQSEDLQALGVGGGRGTQDFLSFQLFQLAWEYFHEENLGQYFY